MHASFVVENLVCGSAPDPLLVFEATADLIREADTRLGMEG
jgi:hypothetical protein